MADKEPAAQDLSKYLKDIETIKDLLCKAEKNPIYASWAFSAWGGLIMLGALIQYLVEKRANTPPLSLFLEIWLPIILAMGIIELFALIKNMSKRALTITNRTIQRYILSLIGTSLGLLPLLLLFYKLGVRQEMPLILLLGMAVYYFLLASSGYTQLYIHGFIFILLAIVLYRFQLAHHVLVLLVGLIVGFSMITAGITLTIGENKDE